MPEDVATNLTRVIYAPIPDDAFADVDLRPFGWAPGGYFGRGCLDCSEGFSGDKRCRRCRACAIKALVAHRDRPRWQSGHEGIPTDRPVWAYFYDNGSGDGQDVTLLRGVSDEDGETFTVDYEGRPWERDGHIVCWIDAQERPSLSVEAVEAILAVLPSEAFDLCLGHVVEDWLHREALRAVVDGHRDAPAIAAAALKSRELKFSRYYD
ncbi:hypothetical protein ABZT49_12260 [Methylobacterium sp. EM32]|uniref:hypothetical protein n=1 Tax=Methylobacterium sp. EM32 TaxID=3163481 RepID=UPI0033B09844